MNTTATQARLPGRIIALCLTLLLAEVGGTAHSQGAGAPSAEAPPPSVVQRLPDGGLQRRLLLDPAGAQGVADANEALLSDPARRAPALPQPSARVTLTARAARPRTGAAPRALSASAIVSVVGGAVLPVTVSVSDGFYASTVQIASSDPAAIPDQTQAWRPFWGRRNPAIYFATNAVTAPVVVYLTVSIPGSGDGSQGLSVFVRPNSLDHITWQTPIRDQGGRNTCTYFAATAAVEAAYKRWGQTLDLSEQNLTWLRDNTMLADDGGRPSLSDASYFENLPGSLSGGGGVYNLGLMSHYGICPEADCPYIGDASYEDYSRNPIYAPAGIASFQWWSDAPLQRGINQWNSARPQFSDAARRDSVYGVGGYAVLSDGQMHDPNYVEQVLAEGYDVVLGFHLRGNPGTRQIPVWQPTGASPGDHCVLLVGYDHARHFFIAKNSWGYVAYDPARLAPGWTDLPRYNGYTLLDESYLSQAYEAGYVQWPSAANTPGHALQQAMGQWYFIYYRRSTGRYVGSGTLTVRHLPGTATLRGGAMADRRLGDFVDGATGLDYRVNAVIGSQDGNGQFPISFYINYGQPGTMPDALGGFRLDANLDVSVGGKYSYIFGSGVTSGWWFDWFLTIDGVPLYDLSFWAYHT